MSRKILKRILLLNNSSATYYFFNLANSQNQTINLFETIWSQKLRKIRRKRVSQSSFCQAIIDGQTQIDEFVVSEHDWPTVP